MLYHAMMDHQRLELQLRPVDITNFAGSFTQTANANASHLPRTGRSGTRSGRCNWNHTIRSVSSVSSSKLLHDISFYMRFYSLNCWRSVCLLISFGGESV